MADFTEPDFHLGDAAALLAGYLAAYREVVIGKVESLETLEAGELRVSRLASGWTPIELVNHLAFMERRWFVWGFLGQPVEEPWGDVRDGRWHVEERTPLSHVVGLLRAVGVETDRVLVDHSLEEPASTGGRFDDPPTLGWICLHVLQEYARHAGHLDIAVELAGGPTGE